MMQSSPISPVYLAIPLLILFLAGCAGGPAMQSQGREPTSAPRSFVPVSGDRWIGNGICYGPHRDGQRPGQASPSAAEIREDLELMARHWSLLRTYGASEFSRTLLEEIRTSGIDMKMILGVWIEPEDRRDESGAVIENLPEGAAANRRESEAAIALAAEYADIVVAVCVGNETQVFWSPYPCPLDLLITHVRRVREAVTQPVTAADDYLYWNLPESRTLAAEVDFIMIHAHPLWNGQQLDQSLSWLREQVAVVEAVHPGRLVVIGETGWATSVADVGEEARLIKGTVGEAEQAVFYAAARAWAEAEQVTTLIFEAFDENWKGGDHPEEVEKHWGVFRADRTPKEAVRDDASRP
jgi:exo-beta-1,3-glucanase (GH17 family)